MKGKTLEEIIQDTKTMKSEHPGKENIAATGELRIVHFDKLGNVKGDDTYKNLVVTTGRNHIAAILVDPVSEGSMSHMAIGEGTVVQTVGDSALVSELSRKALDSKTQGVGADANKSIYVASWGTGEGTGDITEAGIFNASSSGVMLCRTTFPLKSKGSGDTLSFQWTLTISG